MVHDFTRGHTPGFRYSSEAALDNSRARRAGRQNIHVAEPQTRVRPAQAALPAYARPMGTCAHTRVRHSWRACRRCIRVRLMYFTPSG